MAKANACIFCGGEGGSDEHIFARWVSKALPGEGYFTSGGDGRRTKQSKRIAVITRSVCSTCNGTWMSAAEEEIAPLLTPALLGQSVEWDEAALRRIAYWTFKTALAADSGFPKRVATPRHAPAMFSSRAVPDDVRVSTGRLEYNLQKGQYDSAATHRTFLTAHLASGKKVAGYRIALPIGELALVVDSFDGLDAALWRPEPALVRGDEPLSDFLLPVWPPDGPHLSWPPPTAIHAEGWAVVR